MKEFNRFSLALQALDELAPEIESASRADSDQPTPEPALPTLDDVLAELSPLPHSALFLGLATDGLPVLLNLQDPAPGPLLLAADAGAGKTVFLQTIAKAIASLHDAEDVQFGVVTNYPDEWESFDQLANCIGIFPSYHDASVEFLLSLVSWAHANKGGKQSILLLVDDLESLTEADAETCQNLRWLLLRGPARRVWPLITLNAARGEHVSPWLDAFRTRLFGHVKDIRATDELTGIPGSDLSSLAPGCQFALREGRHWLKFWLPLLK